MSLRKFLVLSNCVRFLKSSSFRNAHPQLTSSCIEWFSISKTHASPFPNRLEILYFRLMILDEPVNKSIWYRIQYFWAGEFAVIFSSRKIPYSNRSCFKFKTRMYRQQTQIYRIQLHDPRTFVARIFGKCFD